MVSRLPYTSLSFFLKKTGNLMCHVTILAFMSALAKVREATVSMFIRKNKSASTGGIFIILDI